MSKPEPIEAARRSYELRLRSLHQDAERLETAKAELSQLFAETFRHPEAAAAKFVDLVERQGLARAVRTMHADPRKPAPAWKALVGSVHPFDGINRARERALERLAELPTLYQQAEQAQRKHAVAEQLMAEVSQELAQLQAAAPPLPAMPIQQRPKRKLRQRP